MINYIIPIIIKDKPKGFVSKRRVTNSVDHAWRTQISWRPASKKPKIDAGWVCSTRPGFVNCIDPRVPAAEAEALKTSPNGFVKPKYNIGGGLMDGTEIGLLDAPSMPITKWRDITEPIVDDSGSIRHESVPPFFFSLGFSNQSGLVGDINLASFDNFKINIDVAIQNQARSLFKADLFLVQARTTYAISTLIPGNFITGQIVDYAVTYNSTTLAAEGNRPQLMSMPLMPTPHTATFEERLGGGYGDDGMDYFKIATLYWLSPPINGSADDSTPPVDPSDVDKNGNPTWTPYVQHYVFYNLSYQSKNPRPDNVRVSGLDPFLSFFLGQYSFAPAATYGAMQSVEQQVFEAMLNTTDNMGQFWST